ncbi:membrane protein insertion efficiency factor YidD, partial [Proteus mirabilis]
MRLKQLFILPIRCYQYFLSPWIGQSCRFTPSCSNYMIEAIETHGVCKGLWLGTKRIARCN